MFLPCAMFWLGLKLEGLLKQKGLENKVTKSHSFENMSKNDPMLVQNSAKATDIANACLPIKDQVDARKEIANYANTSHG